VLGARRLDRLEALADELGLDKNAVVKTDVTDREQVKALVDRAVELQGRVDVMVNNAGLMPLSPLEMERFDEWDQAIDVNIKGVLWGIAAALPHFKQQKSGQFINVSSVAGHTISPGGAIYSATKYSVRVIFEALRQEVKPYDIRTTVISPGAVDTELPSSVKAQGRGRPDRRLLRAERDPRRQLRPVRAVRHRPAGRRRRQRDPVPPDESGALTRISLLPRSPPAQRRRGASHRGRAGVAGPPHHSCELDEHQH
jgi:NADP-dependent 3-hydroxy acid dehydrogenase YdfG